jgi:hypothetical protein
MAYVGIRRTADKNLVLYGFRRRRGGSAESFGHNFGRRLELIIGKVREFNEYQLESDLDLFEEANA